MGNLFNVLIAEDQAILALTYEDAVTGVGLPVVGPFVSGNAAGQWLDRAEQLPVLALVDYHLKDGPCHSLVERLRREKVPVVLLTGAVVPGEFQDVPLLSKPFSKRELVDLISRMGFGVPEQEVCGHSLSHEMHATSGEIPELQAGADGVSSGP